MKTLSEKIAVMQAALDGAQIQAGGDDEWRDIKEPVFAWDKFDYRIAPKKPMEFTIALHEGKVVGVGGVERGDYVVIDSPKSLIGVTTIRVREVVEEPKLRRTGRYMRFGPHCRQWSDDKVTWWDDV